MPRWADRIDARVGTRRARSKGFSMPPFWSIDGARVALATQGISPDRESLGNGFEDYVHNLYKANGAIFAVIAARCRIFSQANFMYMKYDKGRPGDLFSNESLGILQRPWQNGTKGEMLTHMDVDVAMAGNNYLTVADKAGNIGPSRVKAENEPFVARLRPDWVQLVINAPSGNPFNPDAHVLGLWFSPPNGNPTFLLAKEYSHYSPIPDPTARFRGMSWITPVLRDIQGDTAITNHKISFLRNGATPNLSVVLPEDTEDEDFLAFVENFREEYEGSANAYKTLILTGGADVTPLSVDFQALDLKSMQGGLETRMCAAGGVHPSIVGLSEGLQGSTLNQGNYTAARRIASDMTVRSLWDMAAASLENLVKLPSTGHRLMVDIRDIPFMREDAKDEADIFFVLSQAIRQLVDGGYKPDAVVKAAKARDIELLVGQHSGKLSVQLQEPGAKPASANGNGNGAMPELETTRSSNGGRQTATR